MKDLISRQSAIDAMCELMHHWFGSDSKDEIREIKRELEKLPSVESNIKTLTPEEVAGEISPFSPYSAYEWYDVALQFYRLGYVVCRRENG